MTKNNDLVQFIQTGSAAILEAIGDAISIQDKELRIIYQNKAHINLMGNHLGEYCYAAYQGKDEPCPDCHLLESFKDGLIHRRESFTARRERGRVYVEIISAPIKNTEGEIIGGIESVREITERILLEEKLIKHITAIEASMEGIAILNSKGRYIFLNQAHAALYGFDDPAELIGKSWQLLYDPEELNRFQKDIFPCFMEKGKWHGEAVGRRKDGTTFQQELSLVLTEDGGIVCVVRDISERKRAERKLQNLSSFPELNPNPVIEVTVNGDLSYANPSALKVLESIGKGKDDISLFFPDDLKSILREWSGDGEKLHSREVEVASRVFSETIHFVNNINVARIYANDITRQKQIEQQLKTSEESYRQFTNLTSDFVHICSRSGAEPFRIQWTGGVLNSISGYSVEEIFALGCFIPFVHSDDSEKVSSELSSMVPGEVKIIEFRIVTKQDEIRWIAQKCRCEKGAEEGELLLYSSIRDITDRKQMEETLHSTFAGLKRHDNRMRLLHEMNDKLLSVESRKEVCAVIIDSAAQLFPEYSGLLAICPENCNEFQIVASWGSDFDMNATFTMSDCWALQGKLSHKVCDSSQSLGCKLFQGKSSEPHFCLPLMARGETLGLLQIISPENVSNAQLDEMYDFAITMSETISLALSNLMLREALREEAIRDPLTGLFNRRYLEETLPLSLRHQQRNNEPLTVAMIDLDNFKVFNDQYGHEAGDLVLKEIGALLRSSLRGGDIACRYGGEELLIILSGATLEHALPRMETIREMVMNHCIYSSGRKLPAITVSIGISEAKPDEIDAAAILKRADTALYQAKQNGRNRIMKA